MERLALQPVPMKSTVEFRIDCLCRALNAKLDMLHWFEHHLPDRLREEAVALFDNLTQLERIVREQADQETQWWRWLAARFYLARFASHIEELGDIERKRLGAVKVDGNVYDITDALRQKETQ